MTLRFDNATKRQRTDKIEDNRIVVNVGGKFFPTFRSTLTMKSTYFEKRLSGRFSDDAGDSEIIVDRDHEPFGVILSYLRSGKLLILPDKLLFSSVLIEADFYGIDELIDMVRDKFYCNLNHIRIDQGYDEAALAHCIIEFPSYEQLMEHPKFPSVYFSAESYYRVISTQILPKNKFVRVCPVDVCFVEVWQSITFERLSDGRIYTEPALIPLPYCDPVVDWTSIKDPLNWPKKSIDCRNLKQYGLHQHIPISFWLGLNGFDDSWYMCTKSILAPNDTNHKYTVRINGHFETKNAELVEVYTLDATYDFNNSVSEFRVMAYADHRGVIEDLVNVKELDNFMHFGPKK